MVAASVGTILIIIILLGGGIYYYHTAVGKFVWNKFRFAPAALALNRDATLALEIGNYYFNVGGSGVYDLRRAERYFYRALEIDPNVPDAWHQLSRIDFLRGDFWSALQKINKQIEIHGDSFMASFYIRGLILGFMGNFDEAEDNFKKILSWDPGNWAIANDLAWIYFQKGDYKKTEEMARYGLERNSENVWLLTSLGVALLNQQKREEALTALMKARENVEHLTESDWSKAYPGNDPRLAGKGLENMKRTIEENIRLASSPK